MFCISYTEALWTCVFLVCVLHTWFWASCVPYWHTPSVFERVCHICAFVRRRVLGISPRTLSTVCSSVEEHPLLKQPVGDALAHKPLHILRRHRLQLRLFLQAVRYCDIARFWKNSSNLARAWSSLDRGWNLLEIIWALPPHTFIS